MFAAGTKKLGQLLEGARGPFRAGEFSTRTLGFAASALVLTAIAGCDKTPQRVAVSGQVLIDGQPLKYGVVRFVPKGGRPSDADLDENGRFTLTSFKPGDGAAMGVHQIAIFANEQLNDAGDMKWYAPKRYRNYTSSGLTQEITGPTDTVVINLTWKGDEHGKPFVEKSNAPVEPSKTAIK